MQLAVKDLVDALPAPQRGEGLGIEGGPVHHQFERQLIADAPDPFALNFGPLPLALDCLDRLANTVGIGDQRIAQRGLPDIADDRGGKARPRFPNSSSRGPPMLADCARRIAK